jgi:hypothetical protein
MTAKQMTPQPNDAPANDNQFSCRKSLTLPQTAIILFDGNFLRKNNGTP